MVRGANIDDHHDLDRIVQPIRDGIIANYLYLPDAQGSVLIRVIAFRLRMFPKSANEIHDSPPLDATVRYGVEEVGMQVDLIPSHAPLFFVESFLKLFGCQPMRRIFVGSATFHSLLVGRIRTMPKVKQKCAHLALFAGG